MSKFVKDLLTKDLVGRLEGVEDCLTANVIGLDANTCLLYTSPSPRDRQKSRMPSSA